MKKLATFLLLLALISPPEVYAYRIFGGGYKEQVDAKDIDSNTSNFNGNLSSSDTTVQKALDTLDDMSAGGGSMVYPDAGIPLSTGSAWGTSITNSSANWNTAYGWGNHASAGYLTGVTVDSPLSGAGTSASHLTVDLSSKQAADAGLTSLAGLTYTSGTPFVKYSADNTFSLDTNTYLTSESDPIVSAQANGFTITRGTTPATLTVATSGSVSGSNTGDQTLASLGAEAVANKATTFGTVNDTLYPTVKAVNDAITTAVTGLLDYRGSYDASVNTFPATGGSGLLGAILKGDFWICTVAGTLGGVSVTSGDLIIALQDTPAQTASNWNLVEHDFGYTAENTANKVTSISGASTDVQYPSAKLLYDQLALKLGTTLNSANIFVGNGSNVAAGVAISGDASLSNAGVLGVNKTRLNVRNETGVTIGTSKAVYVSGFNNLPLIILADNTNEAKHNVIGITVGSIAHETNGILSTGGQCDAETNSWTVGDELYLSTSGELVNAEPTAGSVIHVGIVTVKANYPTGKILIYQLPEGNTMAAGSGQDLIIRMGDSAGAKKTSFRDYANAEVSYIDSNGNFSGLNLSGTNTGDNAANTSIAATKLDDFATPDDNTDLNANTTNHGLLLKATAPAAGLYNYVGITNGETAYTNKALFDATVPSTQAFGDAAATGSAAVSARRDHKHAMPATPTVEGTAVLSTGEVGGTKFLREDGDGTCSWQTPAGTGDMVLASVQSVTGLKTFDTTKLAVKGSSTGSTAVASANSSATDYTQTLQAKTGTIANQDDVTYIGSTSVALNRASAPLTLAGITLTTPDIGAATGTSLDLGTTTKLESRLLTVDTGGVFNVALSSAAGDDFTVDTNKLVVEGDTGNVGIGTTAPLQTLHVSGGTTSALTDVLLLSGGNGTSAGYTGASLVFNSNPVSYPTWQLGKVSGMYLTGGAGYAGGLLFFTNTGASATSNTEKMRIDPNGNVGIGTATPTAKLHLPAGTASASTAPLKLTSGTLNTTPEAGAVEFLTDGYYGTITTGTARKQFAFTDTAPAAHAASHNVGGSDAITQQVYKAEVTFTSNQIKNLVGTPVRIVTGIANKILCPVNGIWAYTYGTAAYTAGGTIHLRDSGGSATVINSVCTTAIMQAAASSYRGNIGAGSVARLAGADLEIYAVTTDYATGDGTVKYTLFYTIVDA